MSKALQTIASPSAVYPPISIHIGTIMSTPRNHATDEKQHPNRPREDMFQQENNPQKSKTNDKEKRHQEGSIECNPKTLKQRTMSYGMKEIRRMELDLQLGVKMRKKEVEEPVNKQESRKGTGLLEARSSRSVQDQVSADFLQRQVKTCLCLPCLPLP